jgi:hypothetical protein
MAPILSQMNPAHTFSPYLSKIRSNIFHLHLCLVSDFFLSCFPTNFFVPLSFQMCATSHVHFILINLITLVTFNEEYKLWSFSLCNLLQLSTTSSFLGSFSWETKIDTHTRQQSWQWITNYYDDNCCEASLWGESFGSFCKKKKTSAERE